MNAELQPGDRAPDFAADAAGPGEQADSVSLSGLRGRRVVLCFYPFEDVPAAREQLSALRDAWHQIRGKATLLAISREDAETHARVSAQLGLPFPLVTDLDDRIAKAYGIWLTEGGGGDVEGGSQTERTSFVIDPDGKISAILHEEKPAEHVARLLALM